MAIYKLFPVDHSPLKWQSCRYRGEAIVRADNEEHARQLGTHEFCIPRPALTSSPWEDPQTVLCHPMNDGGYNELGPQKVLSPRLTGDHN